MPLNKSGSKEAIGQNIKTEQAAGKPHDQAVAIALNTDRKAGGGHVGSMPDHSNLHRSGAANPDHSSHHGPHMDHVKAAGHGSHKGKY